MSIALTTFVIMQTQLFAHTSWSSLFSVVVFVLDRFSRYFLGGWGISSHCTISFSHCRVTNKIDAQPDDFPVYSHTPCLYKLKCAVYLEYFRIICFKLKSAIIYVILYQNATLKNNYICNNYLNLLRENIIVKGKKVVLKGSI